MVSDHASNAVGGSRGERPLLSRLDAEAAVNAQVRLIAQGVINDLSEKYGRRGALEVVQEVLGALVELARLDAGGTS